MSWLVCAEEEEGQEFSEKPLTVGDFETAYPVTWARLKEGIYSQGSFEIELDPRDYGDLSQWRQDSKIVITNLAITITYFISSYNFLNYSVKT